MVEREKCQGSLSLNNGFWHCPGVHALLLTTAALSRAWSPALAAVLQICLVAAVLGTNTRRWSNGPGTANRWRRRRDVAQDGAEKDPRKRRDLCRPGPHPRARHLRRESRCFRRSRLHCHRSCRCCRPNCCRLRPSCPQSRSSLRPRSSHRCPSSRPFRSSLPSRSIPLRRSRQPEHPRSRPESRSCRHSHPNLCRCCPRSRPHHPERHPRSSRQAHSQPQGHRRKEGHP